METTEKHIARKLLEIEAVKINLQNPFTWASGWKSPIYCDNRKILSYPGARSIVCDAFVNLIRTKYPTVQCIAGVATGAIAYGALVASALELPFVYVRSSAKGHGLQNQVEGELKRGQEIVVIEDLISSGGSSLKAVEALKNVGAIIMGLTAIFTYGFQAAIDKFDAAGCQFATLSNYSVLIEEAIDMNYISKDQLDLLKSWRVAPEKWSV